MALVNLGFKTDPSDLNRRLTQADSFTPRGWLIWDGIRKVTDGQAKARFYKSVDAGLINQCIVDGYYPLVQFYLPNGRVVDSIGRDYDIDADPSDDDLYVEKVSLALCDDLTVGDAINFFSIQEAPYRPFLTYRARVALDGPLVAGEGGTTIRIPSLGRTDKQDDSEALTSRSGRMMASRPAPKDQVPPGPEPKNLRRMSEDPPENSTETED